MRIFVRHIRTGHYYNGALNWVAARDDASDLGSIDRAVDVVAHEKLDGMSLVLVDEQSGGEEVFDFSGLGACATL